MNVFLLLNLFWAKIMYYKKKLAFLKCFLLKIQGTRNEFIVN